jgi:hypothetical protein
MMSIVKEMGGKAGRVEDEIEKGHLKSDGVSVAGRGRSSSFCSVLHRIHLLECTGTPWFAWFVCVWPEAAGRDQLFAGRH